MVLKLVLEARSGPKYSYDHGNMRKKTELDRPKLASKLVPGQGNMLQRNPHR